MHFGRTFLISAGLGACLYSPVVHANLIIDGSFETPLVGEVGELPGFDWVPGLCRRGSAGRLDGGGNKHDGKRYPASE